MAANLAMIFFSMKPAPISGGGCGSLPAGLMFIICPSGASGKGELDFRGEGKGPAAIRPQARPVSGLGRRDDAGQTRTFITNFCTGVGAWRATCTMWTSSGKTTRIFPGSMGIHADTGPV